MTWKLWAGGTIVFLSGLLLGNFFEYHVFAGLAKGAASVCFIAVAITRGARESRYGNLILGGLALSWFGDVFLIGSAQTLFLAGLVSFLLAHVAYTTAFVAHGANRNWAAGAAVVLAPIVIAVVRWLFPHVESGMTIPVAIYVAVITAMTLTAWGAFGNGLILSAPIGATMFFLSDIAVARNRFIDPGSMDWLWGLPLYYGGQLFLAYSVGRAITATPKAAPTAR